MILFYIHVNRFNCYVTRLRRSAIVKGVDISCFPIKDINNELKGANQHDAFKDLILTDKLRVPILGVKRDVNTTEYFDPTHKTESHLISFGIPRWFFRFSFTSAINDVPYAYLSWIKFTLHEKSNSCVVGHMSASEWNNGPFISKNDNINPFCAIDYIFPSRSFSYLCHIL